jgi:hypothetical protein
MGKRNAGENKNMGCCGKTNRESVTKILKSQKTLRSTVKLLEGIYNVNPSQLNKRKLLDYHMKTHMLYSANTKRKPINITLVNKIVLYHNKFADEMIKRGMKHNTPLRKP